MPCDKIFKVYNLYRALIYLTSSLFIRCNYPMKIFGTLIGTFRIIMGKSLKSRSIKIFLGFTSLINIGFSEITSEYGRDGFDTLSYIFIGLHVVTLSFPILVLIKKYKE